MLRRPIWLAGLALLLIALVYQWPRSYRIDIGSPADQALIGGFYFAEQNGDTNFRWSSGLAGVNFPGVANRDWQLRLRLSGTRPNPPASINLTYNDRRPVATLQLGGEMAEYSATLPRIPYDPFVILFGSRGSVRVYIETSTFTAPPDTRELGVQVDWVELSPVGGGVAIPPLYPWLGLSLVVGLLAAAGQRFGLTGRRWQLWSGSWLLLTLLALIAASLWVNSHLGWVFGTALIFWLISRWMRDAGVMAWVLLGVVALAGVGFALRAIEFYSNSLPPGDFTIYFDAASNLWRGQPLYDFKAVSEMPNGPVYKYPPLFAIVIAPFTSFPIWNVAAGWYLLNLALYGLIFGLSVSLILHDTETRSVTQRRIFVLLSALLFLIFQPTWESLIRGQLDVLILAAAMVGLWCYLRKQHMWLAGVLLAFVTMLKLYPGLLVLYLLWKRRFSAVAGFIVGFAGFTLLSGIVAGWDVMWRYVSEVLSVQTAAVPWPENQSWTGLLSRFVIPAAKTTWYTTIPFDPAMRWLLYALVLSTVLLSVVALGRRAASAYTFIQGYFVTLLLMVMLWPTSWIHYETLLLPAFLLLLYRQIDPAYRRWWRMLLLALSFGLIAFGNEYTVLTPELHADTWLRLLQSYKFFGMLVLWGLHLTDRSE